jgi:hypothetical protein
MPVSSARPHAHRLEKGVAVGTANALHPITPRADSRRNGTPKTLTLFLLPPAFTLTTPPPPQLPRAEEPSAQGTGVFLDPSL